MRGVGRLVAAWPQVARRMIANWKLLSTVIIGVLLASAIMSGTVIYFDALRELALRGALAELSVDETNIAIKSDRGPTTYAERDKVAAATEREIDARVGWMLRDRATGVKTSTFFLSELGEEDFADTDNPRTFFGHLPRLPDHIDIESGGRMPGDAPAPSADGTPTVEALVPLDAAQDLGVGVGDRLAAVPYWSDSADYIHVVVSGVFTRRDPSDEFWHLNDRIFHASTGGSFQTLPFYLTEKAYYEVLGATFRQMDSVFGWLLMVDAAALNARNSTFARQSLRAMEERLSASLFSYRQLTELDNALADYDTRLFFSKLPMFVILVLISIVILYYVASLSSLVVEQQRGELILLKSRGASATQALAVYALEGLTIVALSIAAAPPLAAAVISLLGVTPAFSDLSGGSRLGVAISPAAYFMGALGGALSFAALMAPAIQASRASVASFRQESARPYTQPFYQRYYLDVLALIVAALLMRQLAERGSVVAVGVFGEVAVDQALLAAPAVTLVASALVLLRLFPLFMRLSSALLSSFLPAGLALAVWQMARNPTHYARLSLMLILMAGLGIFAASFGGTLQRSFEERALYSTGADVRVEGTLLNTRGESVPVRESYERLPGVDEAALAFRGFGSDLSKLLADSYIMFAVEGEKISRMGWFRDDFSDEPMADMLNSLEVDTLPTGVELPRDAVGVGVRFRPDRPHPSVALAVRMRDANGRYLTYLMGALERGEWLDMRRPLDRSDRGRPDDFQPAPPLTLVSVTVHETNGRNRLRAGSIAVDEVYAIMPDGESRSVEAFETVSEWTRMRTVPEAQSDVVKQSEGAATFVWAEGRPLVSRGIYRGPPLDPLPSIASRRFMRVNDHRVGETIEVSAQGRRVHVTLIGEMDFFPTLDIYDRSYIIADLTAVSAYANLQATSGELRPNEVWLTTNGSSADRADLVAALEDDMPFPNRGVHDRDGELAEVSVDPLVSAGWRALLFVAFAAVLVLSGLGFLAHAYVSFKNRESQFALMRTVGFSMGQLTTLVLLEQALVIGAGLALGTWMGGRLGATMMPFLGHDDRGARALPPFITDTNWGTLGLTYLAMGILFSLIIAGVILLVRRVSLQRILRMGDV